MTFLRCAKKPDFGAGVLVYLDFLCIDTPIHAKAPGPAPPQIYKPEKQPFWKTNVYKFHIEQLHLDLMQEERPGAVTWWLYSTSIGYPTINIWGLGALERPWTVKEFMVSGGQRKKGGYPKFDLPHRELGENQPHVSHMKAQPRPNLTPKGLTGSILCLRVIVGKVGVEQYF